jgi:hypothetical protein
LHLIRQPQLKHLKQVELPWVWERSKITQTKFQSKSNLSNICGINGEHK